MLSPEAGELGLAVLNDVGPWPREPPAIWPREPPACGRVRQLACARAGSSRAVDWPPGAAGAPARP